MNQALAMILVVLGLMLVAVWLTVLELRSAKELGLVEQLDWKKDSRQAQELSQEKLRLQDLS